MRSRRLVLPTIVALFAISCGSSDRTTDADVGSDTSGTSPSTSATRPSSTTRSSSTPIVDSSHTAGAPTPPIPTTTVTPTPTTTTTTTSTTTTTTTVPTSTIPTTSTVGVAPPAAPATTNATSAPSDGTGPPSTERDDDQRGPDTLIVPSALPATGRPIRPAVDPFFPATNSAFDRLARGNTGASLSVSRAGELVVTRASGVTIDGHPATSDTPMVVASVSKIVVALAVARLVEAGALRTDEVVPWGDIGILPNGAWMNVTIRELLDHTSGVPKVQSSWFTGGTTCPAFIQELVVRPPLGHRGRWVYSNGNYCLLGMVVAQRTGLPLDDALQLVVFDPVGVDGVHLTDDGLLPGDMPHPHGVARLSRLGGAGTLVVSTDDIALAIGRLTPADREILRPPGVFTDQYGFGHTGTIDGAKACVWALDGGDTVVAATIAGNGTGTGGAVCDLVVPAIAADLGIGAGRPERTP